MKEQVSAYFDRAIQSRIQWLQDDFLTKHGVKFGLVRIDEIDAETGGNKWFKLKYNIAAADAQGLNTIVTFGGPFSNHIAATAAACRILGLKSIGVIRSEVNYDNPTLQKAKADGMQLHFVSKAAYANKYSEAFISDLKGQYGNFYWIPEGGDNEAGLKGCEEIWSHCKDLPVFDKNQALYFASAIGRGNTFAGLVNSCPFPNAIGLGFTGFKQGEEMVPILAQKIKSNIQWQVITSYHFGGFGRVNEPLIDFFKAFEKEHQVVLDYTYTAKMCYGIYDLIHNNKIEYGSTVVAFHTGGIQGNKGIEK